MRRSGQTPSRPSSRSGPPIYISLVSTKESLQDTLFINKTSGVPLYATITQGENTSLYAVDSNITLQRVATISWGQGGKSSPTTITNAIDQTKSLGDILVGNNSAFDCLVDKTGDRTYSYGLFACRWRAHRDGSFPAWGDNFTCYRHSTRLPSDTSHLPTSPSPPASSSQAGPEKAIATFFVSILAGKSRTRIDIHARELLQQQVGEDAFTDLDHVVLGTLLMSNDGGRKPGREPRGWLNEAQLQEQLRSQHRAPRSSNETLPLYQAQASSPEGHPPPYSSRISISSSRSIRSMTR